MQCEFGLCTLIFVLLIYTTHTKTADSNKDFFLETDSVNSTGSVDTDSSGSGTTPDLEGSSGGGPDDEDATGEDGSGKEPVVGVTTYRQLTLCQRKRAAGTQTFDSDSYIPVCTASGKFEKLQCRSETTCFCVDPLGVEIRGTSKYGEMDNPRMRPDCEGGSNLSPCMTLLVKSSWSGLLGARKPSCTLSGQFKPMQCHENECWCVDDLGRAIGGSAKILPNLPDCHVKIHHDSTTTRPPRPRPGTDKDITLEETEDNKGYNIKGNEGKSIDVDDEDDYYDESDDEDDDDDEEISKNDSRYGMNKQGRDDRYSPTPLIEQPGIMAGIIAGAFVGLLCAVLLVMFIVYRIRKKDSGSYALDEPTKPRGAYAYQKAPDKEFYA